MIYLLQYKYEIRYQNRYMKNDFALVYEILYEGLKTDSYGWLQYYSLFLLRK